MLQAQGLSAVQFADVDHGWAFSRGDGGDGYALPTTDGGQTWAELPTPPWLTAGSDPVLPADFVSSSLGYVVNLWHGGVMRTTDCGYTWTWP